MNEPLNQARTPGKNPARGEAEPKTPPLLIPWTWGEYYAVRYLAGTRRQSIDDLAREALRRGMQVLAAETLAGHIGRGKIVPQRLALLAGGSAQGAFSTPLPRAGST